MNCDAAKWMERYLEARKREARAKREVEALQEEIDRIRIETTYASSVIDGMIHGGNDKDKMAEYIARLEALEGKIASALAREFKQIEMCHAIRREVKNVINQLPGETAQTLMFLRYIEGMTYERVADIMGYSDRHIRRMHEALLDECAKIIAACP